MPACRQAGADANRHLLKDNGYNLCRPSDSINHLLIKWKN